MSSQVAPVRPSAVSHSRISPFPASVSPNPARVSSQSRQSGRQLSHTHVLAPSQPLLVLTRPACRLSRPVRPSAVSHSCISPFPASVSANPARVSSQSRQSGRQLSHTHVLAPSQPLLVLTRPACRLSRASQAVSCLTLSY